MHTLRSEDDVRTKVVVPWLLSRGFSLAAISIEFSFRIRLGRSILRVRGGVTSRDDTYATYSPRADILVRNERGDNLLIIEVKAPGEALDGQAQDQAISYARCIAEGNIAPYVVVTNGRSTRVFDSISKLEVGEDVQLSDACITRSLYVTPDELSLRSEALEALISLSPGNLMAFCEAQARFRMKPLFGENLDSDKKFVPGLFVQREEVDSLLTQALDVNGHRVTLLIGHPQVGKTNVVCHTVIERITRGQPCLFYPAIGLQRTLLAEIGDDFEWEFGGAADTYSQLARKLNKVLQRAKKRLTIFIDGLNETSVQLARAIDADCSRLSSDHIRIVISLTHSSATRMLRDAAGNSSFLAEEAGIPSHGASLIELDPEAAAKTSGWNCIHVRRYSLDECDRAYDVYARAYGVTVPDAHQRTLDPYVLGIAMKQFRGGRLPECLDEPSLLHAFIVNKIGRAVGLENYNIPLCLRELGREMVRGGAPVPLVVLGKIWSHPITQKVPNGFFESALLTTEIDANGQQSVDFYYGRERDYVIACMAHDWPQKLAAQENMDSDFSASVATAAGCDALAWFMRQPPHVKLLKAGPGGIPTYSNPRVRQILLSALCEYSSTDEGRGLELLPFAIASAMNDPDHLTRIEAIKLVVLGSDESDDLASVLGCSGSSLGKFIETILSIGEEFPFKADDTGRVVLDALQSLHWDSDTSDDEGTSQISDILSALSEHHGVHIRREANTCLGYVAPLEFARNLAEKIERRSAYIHQGNFGEFSEAIRNTGNVLSNYYYGDLCPGSLEDILEDPDYQAEEYEKMRRHLEPIIHAFGGMNGTDTFKSILEDLGRGLATTAEATPNSPHFDIYTLPLPFEEGDLSDSQSKT